VKKLLAIGLALIIVLSSFLVLANFASQNNGSVDAYVGVTLSLNTMQEAKLLVDKVKDFTNLLVVDSGQQ
jgi:RNase P/RNase MRP subunit p30